MSSTKPVFVLVPGAWHKSDCFKWLVPEVESAGYHTISLDKVSTGDDAPVETTCSDDVQAIRKHIGALVDEGRDVVVVGHSYGGVVASCAAHGLSKAARLQQGNKGGVIGLILIAAILARGGDSVAVTLGGGPEPWQVLGHNSKGEAEGYVFMKDPEKIFYADVDRSRTEELVKMLQGQTLATLGTPAPSPAWSEESFQGKIAYIGCTEDLCIPYSTQQSMLQRTGVQWLVEEMEASHSPFASKPKETARVIVDWAEKFIAA